MGVAFFVKEDSLKRIEPGMQSNESEVGASTQLTRMDALRNSTKVEKVLALDRAEGPLVPKMSVIGS
jgi:hypothetical protein